MNVNDLIGPIIALHKKREVIDQISQREANLVVCAIEIFEAELSKEKKEPVKQNQETNEQPKRVSAEKIRDKYSRQWFNETDDIDDPNTGYMAWPDVLKAMEEHTSQKHITVPNWYTKEELYDWLLRENYSKEIATELSEKYANDLQHSFEKGWEKAKYELSQKHNNKLVDISLLRDTWSECWGVSTRAGCSIDKMQKETEDWLDSRKINWREQPVNFGPEWLTPVIRETAKRIWDSHKTIDDHLRVRAIQYIRGVAHNHGYEIGIKKAMELFKEFCK